MTDYRSAIPPTPEQQREMMREFQADPAMDPDLARWLDRCMPDWREADPDHVATVARLAQNNGWLEEEEP